MHSIVKVLILILFSACSAENSAPITVDSTLPGVIVSPSWLQQNRETVNPLLIDARPLESYQTGHIPGAMSIPMLDLDEKGAGIGSLASVKTIESLFGTRGIQMNRPVLVYDDAIDHRPSARVFWALEVHGHPNVGVLNGGLPAWQALTNQELEVTAPKVKAQSFIAVLQPKRLATQLQTLRASASQASLILDVRSTPEYVGERSGGLRKGHIENALHKDFTNSLAINDTTGTCQMQSLEELKEQYATIPIGKPVIAYCNTGTHASVTYLALRAIGHDVSVYDGGWVEWSKNPELPIRTGSKP